ncbi:MAG: hypothetical protein LBI72_13255 [Flavobacteriaceae bacterium]|jgi:hypothetical protein|nr:hypothetical protein [Flavobacteriaceae bacterium]
MSSLKTKRYHLSYDIKYNSDSQYKKYKEELLCIIKSTDPLKVFSPCASTIIIEYEDNVDVMNIDIFNELLDTNKYYYYVTLVGVNYEEKNLFRKNENSSLQLNFKQEYDILDCD